MTHDWTGDASAARAAGGAGRWRHPASVSDRDHENARFAGDAYAEMLMLASVV
jgi:hypothetical protein